VAEPPDIRASDADRERAADALRRHFGDGRLTLDELEVRLAEVYASRTLGELSSREGPLRELPLLPPPPPIQTRNVDRFNPAAVHHLGRGFPEHVALYLAVNIFLVVIWAASGGGFFWPLFVIGGWGIALAGHYAAARQRPPLRPR
jgi:hypothetical protein